MDPEPSLTDELAGLSPRSVASDDVPGRSPRRYADEDDDEMLAAGLSPSGSYGRAPDGGGARPGKGSVSEASTPTADAKRAGGATTPFDATLVRKLPPGCMPVMLTGTGICATGMLSGSEASTPTAKDKCTGGHAGVLMHILPLVDQSKFVIYLATSPVARASHASHLQ